MAPMSVLVLVAILVIAMTLILSNRLRPDIVALGVALSLGLTGLITHSEALSGFSQPVIFTLMGLYVMTQGLTRRGATRLITTALQRSGAMGEGALLLATMVGAATLSLLMNNVAVAAVMLPSVIEASRRTRVPASRLMMPMAFATSFGGMATLLTTANLVTGAALASAGYRPFGLLDFASVGVPVVLAALAYMMLVGRRVLGSLPASRPMEDPTGLGLPEQYGVGERLGLLVLPAGPARIPATLRDAGLGARFGSTVIALVRAGKVQWSPAPEASLLAEDKLLIVGQSSAAEPLIAEGWRQEGPAAAARELDSYEGQWVEVLIPPRSPYLGRTLRDIGFRGRFEANAIALWRDQASRRTELGDIPLAAGDALLVQAGPGAMARMRGDAGLIVLRSEGVPPINRLQAALSAAIVVGTLLVAALEVLPAGFAMMLGFLLTVITRRITMEEAYRAIDWRVIVIVAGMLPLSVAMTRTGLAATLGEAVVGALSGFGPLAVGIGLLVVTLVLTQVVSSQVVAILMAPVAISTAVHLGVDPRAMAFYVALGASCSFLTPTAHPVNIMVMGVGGYRPADYARVGAGLTLLVVAIIAFVTPLAWPFVITR